MRRIDTIYKPKHNDISIFDYGIKPKRIEYIKDGKKYAKIIYDDRLGADSLTEPKLSSDPESVIDLREEHK